MGPFEPGGDNHAMTLEDQLATLAGLGLTLNDGVTIDDLTTRSAGGIRKRPFDLILFALGKQVEPREGAMCSQAGTSTPSASWRQATTYES